MHFPLINMPIVVQIDFNAAVDHVSHSGLLSNLPDLVIGGSVLNVIVGLLSGEVQRVVVDDVLREYVRVVSGIPQASVLGLLLFLLYTSDLPMILKIILVGYGDDSTSLAKVPKPGNRVPAVLSLYRYLTRICNWGKRWEMLGNPLKPRHW